MAKKRLSKKKRRRRLIRRIILLVFLLGIATGLLLFLPKIIRVISLAQDAKTMVNESSVSTFMESGTTVIYDADGNEIGMVVQRVLTFLPKFEIYKKGTYIGCLRKEFSFLMPHYNIDYNGWHIDGSIMEWDYNILDQRGYSVASVSKELFHMTDTYVIQVNEPEYALDALMFVLAIDAEKCSRT